MSFPYSTEIEYRAMLFASSCHEKAGQHRKHSGLPYIVHPASVVKMVKSVPHTVEMVCAAWLHDVVEDTAVTLEDIGRIFGHKIMVLVEMLTDVSKKSDGSRKVRKAMDRAHTALASPEAKTIKIADILDNTEDIMRQDKDFAVIYIKEKRLQLDTLKEGDRFLWQVADTRINDFLKSLERDKNLTLER